MGRRIRELLVNNLAFKLPQRFRFRIFSYYGINCNARIISPGTIFIDGIASISIGRNTFINYNCIFSRGETITIGENCDIGFEAMFCTSTHQLGNSTRRAGTTECKPIVVGNGCWIGARATILPNVTIGDACIIAAGAVVTKDCAPNGLYAGVPARRIKEL